MVELSSHQIHLLRHTLGDKTMYRNYFVTNIKSNNYHLLCDMVAGGYMVMRKAPDSPASNVIFHATDKGKIAAFPPVKTSKTSTFAKSV